MAPDPTVLAAAPFFLRIKTWILLDSGETRAPGENGYTPVQLALLLLLLEALCPEF